MGLCLGFFQKSEHKFYGEKIIPIDPNATLSEHHVSDNDNGYALLDCVIFMDSFGNRNLATKGTQIPYCNIMPLPLMLRRYRRQLQWVLRRLPE